MSFDQFSRSDHERQENYEIYGSCGILMGMTEHPNTERANTQPNTGEPKLAAFVSWLVLIASFGLSASTWIAIAVLAGFTDHLNLFGGVFDLAWLMPVAIDGYVVVALLLWTAPVPEKVAQFAKANTYAAASVGVIAQSAFHSLTIWTDTNIAWRAVMAAAAGALPPLFAALAVHMRALIRRESGLLNVRPITVRRVIVPSGLSIAEQNTQPITTANGHQIADQISELITVPNGRTDTVVNTPADRAPIAEQNTRTDAEPIAPNAVEANTEQDSAEQPITEQSENDGANVRAITSARRTPNGKANGANSDTARNLQAIKRKYRDWRTDMPSARTIAALLGVSASTGYSYQQKLIAERDAPNTQPATDSADDKEREAVAVS